MQLVGGVVFGTGVVWMVVRGHLARMEGAASGRAGLGLFALGLLLITGGLAVELGQERVGNVGVLVVVVTGVFAVGHAVGRRQGEHREG